MKNIKDVTISIFAIIGFVAILSSFTNQTQEPKYSDLSVLQSLGHVWVYVLDSETGEVYQTKHYTNEKKRAGGKQEWIKISSPIK